MKKLLLMAAIAMSISFAANAQDAVTKVKKTSTPRQKIHNTFSKHKEHNGYKAKAKVDGKERKVKVNTTTGAVKDKTDK